MQITCVKASQGFDWNQGMFRKHTLHRSSIPMPLPYHVVPSAHRKRICCFRLVHCLRLRLAAFRLELFDNASTTHNARGPSVVSCLTAMTRIELFGNGDKVQVADFMDYVNRDLPPKLCRLPLR